MLQTDPLIDWARYTDEYTKGNCRHCGKETKMLVYQQEKNEKGVFFVAYCGECDKVLCRERVARKSA